MVDPNDPRIKELLEALMQQGGPGGRLFGGGGGFRGRATGFGGGSTRGVAGFGRRPLAVLGFQPFAAQSRMGAPNLAAPSAVAGAQSVGAPTPPQYTPAGGSPGFYGQVQAAAAAQNPTPPTERSYHQKLARLFGGGGGY